jgi:inositol oxygenase
MAASVEEAPRVAEADGDKFGTFRDYSKSQVKHFDKIALFYKDCHTYQTVDFVRKMRAKYAPLDKKVMSIWEAFDFLESTPVDESDPDTDKTQDVHSYQTAEACRRLYPDAKYDWFHLAGFLHDLGKILCHPDPAFNEPQWAVVGDKNPVGCAFSESIVYPEFFVENADINDPRYNTKFGIYQPSCGFDNVLMNYGHDEYIYQVLTGNPCTLPAEALFVLRYHSFYASHQHGAYDHLATDSDRQYLHWVKEFQKCDLYSKSDKPEDMPDPKKLHAYYDGLIKKYFPVEKLKW